MDGVFMVRARKCIRCGRLLTSAEAIEKGYGCQCALKARREEEEKKPIDGQMSLEDFWKGAGHGVLFYDCPFAGDKEELAADYHDRRTAEDNSEQKVQAV